MLELEARAQGGGGGGGGADANAAARFFLALVLLAHGALTSKVATTDTPKKRGKKQMTPNVIRFAANTNM